MMPLAMLANLLRKSRVSFPVATLQAEIHGCYIRTNVADSAQVEALVALTVQRFGGIDVMVANAGILGALARTGDYPDEVSLLG